MRVQNRFLIALFFICLPIQAAIDLTREHIEFGTSSSHFYDARTIFTNPAGLGYQTELNGSGLMTSFTVGLNKVRNNEFSLGLAWGYFGLGVERLSHTSGEFSRTSLGLGIPLNPWLYLGSRYSFTGSDQAVADGFNSWDFGLQFRPSTYYSIGLLAEAINQPTVNNQTKDTRLNASITVRPISRLLLQADLFALARDYRNDLGYQVMGQFEVLDGLFVNGGYHKDFSAFVGLRFSWGLGSYYATGRPDIADRSVAFGIQTAAKAYRSFLNPPAAYVTKLGGQIDEKGSRGGLISRQRPPFLKYLRDLDKLARDPAIRLVIVKMPSFPMGYAAAQDYRDALIKLRKNGKQVQVFLSNGGLKEYYVASAASQIHLDPSGTLEFAGLRQSRYFIKGTLDKLDIKAEVFAKGKYKSAPEMFTRRSSSEPHRDAVFESLDLAEKYIREQIASTRPKVANQWEKLHRTVLFSSKEALDAGLIDSIGGFTEETDEMLQRYWQRQHVNYQADDLALLPRITVIAADGDIMESEGGLFSFGMDFLTPGRMAQEFKLALADPRTQAIVLRVSSPGGGVLPSQEIAAIVEKAQKEKPVYVSMGDVAASGGYMISAPAAKIFASPLTLTGSIGVFMGKPNLGGFYRKIGIDKETLSRHKFATLYSEADPLSKEGRQILQRRLDNFYGSFISYVAEKRKLSVAKVDEAAQGRVWFGLRAQKNGLVDENRGYLQTIDYAAEQAGLRKFETVLIDSRKGLFPLFDAGPSFVHSFLGLDAVKIPQPALSLLSLRERAEFLYFCPISHLE